MDAELKSNLYSDSQFSKRELAVIKNLFEQMTSSSLPVNQIEKLAAKVWNCIQDLNLKSLESYLNHLSSLPRSHQGWTQFVDLFKAEQVSFFPTRKLETVVVDFLPQWLNTGSAILKIWMANEDEGQQAYSLAMVLSTKMPVGKDFQILATYPDAILLKKAINGVFEDKYLADFSETYRQNNVTLGTGEVAGWFRMNQNLKNKISFKQDDRNPVLDIVKAEFDLVFFNNELIFPAKR